MSNELRTCKICKRLTQVKTGDVCPTCQMKGEDKFQAVKEYVWDNQGCSIAEVSQVTGVSRHLIMRWVKDERLEMSEGITSLVCSNCGTSIYSGAMCNNCKKSLVNSLATYITASDMEYKKPAGNVGMRFVGK